MVEREAVEDRESQVLCRWLVEENGYLKARVLRDRSVAALLDLMFTRAIVLGCTKDGWGDRYCFEDRGLADKRFDELVSEDEQPEGHVASRRFRK